MNPEDMIVTLEEKLQKGKERGLNTFSPSNYAKALSAVEAARKVMEKSGSMDTVREHLSVADDSFTRATDTEETVQRILTKALQGRKSYQTTLENAKKLYLEGWEEVEEKFAQTEKALADTCISIEERDLEKARSEDFELLGRYQDAEVRVLKRWVMGEPRRVLEQAREEGAKKYAPFSLSATENVFSSVEHFISRNPSKKDEIHKKSSKALFSVKRLLQLTRQGRSFSDMEPEEIALWIDKRFYSLESALAQDNRDKEIDKRIEVLGTSIRDLKQGKATLEGEANQLRTENKNLSSHVNKSQAIMEVERKYERIRGLFSPDEAEILREGERVLVRLRNLRFPMGQAALMPDSFPLLGKVQKAIEIFGNPQIAVEGHTDVNRSAAVAERLSLERARAVKEYLTASHPKLKNRISYAGLGFSRPLTSDKTPSGRAINRRIDVVLMGK